MHCVSSYPAEIRYLNINVINKLKKVFKYPIGYSDHSIVDEACLAAVSLGASIVEKHVTIDKSLSGPDHKMSYTIKQFEKLVKKIRDIETILGTDDKIFSKKEIEIRKMARKSIVAKKNLFKGSKIQTQDLCFKRPGTGISPMEVNNILGKKIRINIIKNKIIKKTYIV